VRRVALIALIGPVLLVAGLTTHALAATRIASPRDSSRVFDRPDSLLHATSEFGILFGTPSLVNLEAGYWPHRVFGARISGFYWGGEVGGFQGNLCVTVTRGRRSRLTLGPVAGRLFGSNGQWTYGGLAWDWNRAPMFLEVGWVYGSGDLRFFEDTHLGLLFQVGLMGGGGVIGPR